MHDYYFFNVKIYNEINNIQTKKKKHRHMGIQGPKFEDKTKNILWRFLNKIN